MLLDAAALLHPMHIWDLLPPPRLLLCGHPLHRHRPLYRHRGYDLHVQVRDTVQYSVYLV